jgi:hypothetical protein
MAIIDDIREKIASGQFEFSQHTVDQSIVRHISIQELREAIAVGEVIEDYPDDKYGPSCLGDFRERYYYARVSMVS